jgi:aminopeptidase N
MILLALIVTACTATAGTTTSSTTSTTAPPATTTTSTTSTTLSATVGAAGIGDEYYPALGNGGYDVTHYDLDLFYNPEANALDAAAVISATATQDLTAFNLDFSGFDIVDLRVDDLPATFERGGIELTITPSEPIAAGEEFDVVIAYAGNPTAASSPAFPGVGIGWQEGSDGVQFVVAEPDGAHTWFPANDHPADKATFSYAITVPVGYGVAAAGELVDTESGTSGIGDVVTHHWRMDDPMAPYLATVVIGPDYEVIDDAVSTGVAGIQIRNFLPPDIAEQPPSVLFETGEMLVTLEEAFGPYPFDQYGIAVAGEWPAALENQTLSVFGRPMVDAPFFEYVLVHELAHQWFGDSVSVADWSDIWLNEGFATYAEFLWVEHNGGKVAYDEYVANRRQAAAFAGYPPPGLPPPTDLFNGGVYQLGGLLLADLREEIGDEAFFTLLKAYASEYADANASTEDFIALAEQISGRDLSEFFQVWLYEPFTDE